MAHGPLARLAPASLLKDSPTCRQVFQSTMHGGRAEPFNGFVGGTGAAFKLLCEKRTMDHPFAGNIYKSIYKSIYKALRKALDNRTNSRPTLNHAAR